MSDFSVFSTTSRWHSKTWTEAGTRTIASTLSGVVTGAILALGVFAIGSEAGMQHSIDLFLPAWGGSTAIVGLASYYLLGDEKKDPKEQEMTSMKGDREMLANVKHTPTNDDV